MFFTNFLLCLLVLMPLPRQKVYKPKYRIVLAKCIKTDIDRMTNRITSKFGIVTLKNDTVTDDTTKFDITYVSEELRMQRDDYFNFPTFTIFKPSDFSFFLWRDGQFKQGSPVVINKEHYELGITSLDLISYPLNIEGMIKDPNIKPNYEEAVLFNQVLIESFECSNKADFQALVKKYDNHKQPNVNLFIDKIKYCLINRYAPCAFR